MTARPRVLLIDDEPDLLEVMTDSLDDRGWDVTTASNGPDGLASAARQRPDVVLLDLRMAGVSGVDVLLEMQRRWPGLPVIMLTGTTDMQLATELLRMGAFDYVRKPFDRDHLYKCLAAALLFAGRPTAAAS